MSVENSYCLWKISNCIKNGSAFSNVRIIVQKHVKSIYRVLTFFEFQLLVFIACHRLRSSNIVSIEDQEGEKKKKQSSVD